MGIVRAMGIRYFDGTVKWRGVEVSRGFGLALEINNFGSDEPHLSLHLCLLYGQIYIPIPFVRPWREPEGYLESYGFSWRWSRDCHDAIHLNWGRYCKILHMPWGWDWVRTSYLLDDGSTWAHDLGRARRGVAGLGGRRNGYDCFRRTPQWSAVYPYRYVLRSGVVQNVSATVKVQE